MSFLLSLILWLPLLGAVALLLPMSDRTAKYYAFGLSAVVFVVSLLLIPGVGSLFGGTGLDPSNPNLQLVERFDWIPSVGVDYYLGIDGISVWLVLLTTFLTPITILSTFDSVHVRVRPFEAFMLLLETAMLGVFLTQDLFMFYVFWEFTLIPMAFLIGIWGSGNRVYAAVKFFLFTFAGSVLMLLAIIALYALWGANSFSLPDMVAALRNGQFALDPVLQPYLFLAFFVAFAVKVPLWPVHTWLPDAHTEAPTAGSVILAGVLLKLGSYGLIRFNLQLFPDASRQFAPAIGVLAVIGIIYGAWIAYAQTDIKKLVAYSSVSHLGFVVLGIFALNPLGLHGAILQMVNHGISTGALFLLVGMIYERRHTRDIEAFGGLWKVMPVYGFISLLIIMSSIGLPGAQRLCRRGDGDVRHVQLAGAGLGVRRERPAGRDPGGGVPAVDVPQGVHGRCQPPDQRYDRHDATRDRYAGAAGRAGGADRPVAGALFPHDERLDRGLSRKSDAGRGVEVICLIL